MTEVKRMGSSALDHIPEWAWEVLASPGGGPLRCEGRILWAADQPIGRIDQGILRFNIPRGTHRRSITAALAGHIFTNALPSLTR